MTVNVEWTTGRKDKREALALSSLTARVFHTLTTFSLQCQEAFAVYHTDNTERFFCLDIPGGQQMMWTRSHSFSKQRRLGGRGD